MKQRVFSLAIGLMLAVGAAAADEATLTLAKKSNCLTCHGIDNKIVGPGWKDVAKKYSGDTAAPAKLATKIKAGGKGAWGEIPMPPNPALKDDDVKALVKYILELK
ncbi:c-type cytochrome [Sulfurivermis fontis]|uniref:c-type cytochrome n=1 Tax=Sulfurivermis fontis TaxID=1972068 RepID=UPI000FDA6826|nr:c-type cytochrome [Sulfurivermis fontis]